jgi:AraC-like DNA-binding protein
MAQVLGIPPGDPLPAVRFSRIRPKSPEGTALWKRMLTFAWALLDNPSQGVPPLMVDTLLRSLCSVAISIFPNEMNVGRPYDAGDAHPPAIRRAVAFIETNAQQEISLSDIVAAANVGPRAVQLGFRRYLNTTPMQYLRRVRLAHAHDALKAADPDTDTVAAIARRWGFADLGRFQRMYRDAYGLAAGQTLRR